MRSIVCQVNRVCSLAAHARSVIGIVCVVGELRRLGLGTPDCGHRGFALYGNIVTGLINVAGLILPAEEVRLAIGSAQLVTRLHEFCMGALGVAARILRRASGTHASVVLDVICSLVRVVGEQLNVALNLGRRGERNQVSAFILGVPAVERVPLSHGKLALVFVELVLTDSGIPAHIYGIENVRAINAVVNCDGHIRDFPLGIDDHIACGHFRPSLNLSTIFTTRAGVPTRKRCVLGHSCWASSIVGHVFEIAVQNCFVLNAIGLDYLVAATEFKGVAVSEIVEIKLIVTEVLGVIAVEACI